MTMDVKTITRQPARMKANGSRLEQVQRLIALRNAQLLEHEYFRRCRAGRISRTELLEIVKQLYCFSVFFERLLARRIAEYSSSRDERVISMARAHMREEIGHAQLFRDCLAANGVAERELSQLSPAMFTKAMFGYLTVTIQHENEFVSNVAIMQVMEGIGYHFFSATLKIMQSQDMLADPMEQHTEDDEDHANWGLDFIREFSDATMQDTCRVVDDLYRLMSFVLDEWLGTRRALSVAPERKRRSSRPPRRVAVYS
jgi:pyrroloquinoline quinone (PQQ) biosynthesis protein C